MAYSRRRRFASSDPYVTLLIFETFSRLLNRDQVKPVTLALFAANTLTHYYGSFDMDAVTLAPWRIVEEKEWHRLITSAFVHVNDAHLWANMASFAWKGTLLEGRLGSWRFLKMVAVLLGISHGLVVAVTWAAMRFCEAEEWFYTPAVGFSAVLFALKVVLNHGSSSEGGEVGGGGNNIRWAPWVELIIMQSFIPGYYHQVEVSGRCLNDFLVKAAAWVARVQEDGQVQRIETLPLGIVQLALF
ncbi:hypothetical protein HK102_004254 [Quaeritorhiza haematococci]|nr:hypothetical protein HK102_004254 [Quaeritorhiza haematococci]